MKLLLLIAGCAFSLWLSMPPLRAESPEANHDFEDNLDRILADEVADIRVIFGYDNSADLHAPSDPARARHLATYLTDSGFTMIAPPEALARKLGVPPDARNLRVLEGLGACGEPMRISLMWSSLTSNTAQNIGLGYPQQLVCSRETLKFMQLAASNADVMLYVGHSRGGGGPDTYPPETLNRGRGESQRVDYSYYGRNQPGLEALGPCFEKTTEKPYLIAWTSCLTDVHFHNWFSHVLAGKNHPTSVVLSTRLTNYLPRLNKIEEADEGLLAVICIIEAIRNHPSGADFEERLRTCEIETFRNLNKPAWKLSSIAGTSGHVASGSESMARN